MTQKMKRRIAIEFLLLIVPPILIFLLMIGVQLYLNSWESDLGRRRSVVDSMIESKIDSVRNADLEEIDRIVGNMKRRKAPLAEIRVINDLRYRDYSIGNLRNVLNVDVNTDELMFLRDPLILEDRRLREIERWWFYSDWNNTIPGVIYIFILVAIYPLRGLFLAIRWSIRTLRTPEAH